MVESKATTIKGSTGNPLHVWSFMPEKTPKSVLMLLHGMGEHAARYEDFAKFMAQRGIAVYTHDHRGHGRSLKPSQDVGILDTDDTFEAILEDVDIVYRHVIRQHPGIAVSMLGHSMGSIILRRYLQRFHPELVAVVLSGTLPLQNRIYVKLMRAVARVMGGFKGSEKRCRALAKMMNDGLIKKIPQAQTPFDWICSDADVVTRYIEDPLCGYAYNKRFYNAFFKTIDHADKPENIRKSLPVPVMMISGEDDPLSEDMRAIERLAQRYRALQPHADIEVHAVPKARHEVINEHNKQETYERIRAFLDRKVEDASTS